MQRKSIPLEVKSFQNIDNESTVISDFKDIIPFIPSYIVKEDQILISVSDKNLSFIVEEHLSSIFLLFSKFDTRVNMMQNSAVSFSFCVDYDRYKVNALLMELRKNFNVHFNDKLTMYTIRHYDDNSISELLKDKVLLLEQKSRNTVHFVVK